MSRWTFTYHLGDHRFAVLDVPKDLTPEEEVKLRSLLGVEPFGGFVEKIASEQLRRARLAVPRAVMTNAVAGPATATPRGVR